MIIFLVLIASEPGLPPDNDLTLYGIGGLSASLEAAVERQRVLFRPSG